MNAQTSKPDNNHTVDTAMKSYLAVTSSFVHGLACFWGAEAASSRLMCALAVFHAIGKPGLDGPAAEVLGHLDRIPYSSYDALAYVTNISHLVYATSLLDTFLADTTLFLFLNFPQSMGKNQQVSLRTIIEATSKNEALTQTAMARSREISYLAFTDRIQFLRETYGLNIEIDEETSEALIHYPTVRNVAVHDQGIYRLFLDEHGKVASEQKTCSLHPTNITGDDVYKAFKAYEKVVKAVAASMFNQVLKQVDHPLVKELLKSPRKD
jgi:hypothetical protein